MAKLSLHYKKIPTKLKTEQINDYLYLLKQREPLPSETYFKFTVYGLRFVYRMYNIKHKYVELPSIKKVKRLPIVLSKNEVKRLLIAPVLLKHRILLGLLYSCGLRCFEVRNIKISDLDFDRKMLHVREGKGKKDRYVPLSFHMIRGLKTYIKKEKPKTWIFNGKPIGQAGGDFDSRYSQRGIQWIVNQAKKKANILKDMNVHTLRHTYATHLLEDGLDIMSIRDLLGHVSVSTTMIYLHVAQCDRLRIFSPLDTLYSNEYNRIHPKHSMYSQKISDYFK